MGIVKRNNIESLASALNVDVSHFAKGTYSVRDNSSLPVNRFFTVISNSDYGKNLFSDQHSTHILKEGGIYCIPCYHTICIELNENLQFISIQMNVELIAGIDLFSRCKKIFVFDNPVFFERVQTIYDLKSDIVSSLLLKAHICEIAGLCLKQMKKQELDPVTKFGPYQQVIDYILKNCHAGIKVEDLAAVMNCGREAFTRKFTHDTGIPPKQFFNQFLIKKACELLLGHDITVREVAFALQFSNEYYFSRFFKKNTGMSPSGYQRCHRLH